MQKKGTADGSAVPKGVERFAARSKSAIDDLLRRRARTSRELLVFQTRGEPFGVQ